MFSQRNSEDSMSELKPCPFCGGKPFSGPIREYKNNKYAYWLIECHCFNSAGYDTPYVSVCADNESIALKLWNTRKQPNTTKEV